MFMDDIKIGYHALNESIPKRCPDLDKLNFRFLEALLVKRVQSATILEESDPLYKRLEGCMPPELKSTGKRYYKIDIDPEYPYIYVVEDKPGKGETKEMLLVSIYRQDQFKEHLTVSLKDAVSHKGQ